LDDLAKKINDQREKLKEKQSVMRKKLIDLKEREKRLQVEKSAAVPASDGKIEVKHEVTYECPHCSETISEEMAKEGKCGKCGGKFKIDVEETTVEIFECPHCGRSLTEEIARSGTCVFCSKKFRMS